MSDARPARSHAPPAAATLRVATGARTDVGAVRSENQDALGVLPAVAVASGDVPGRTVPQPAVLVVADGMGGHEAGGEASDVAVDAVLGSFGPGFRRQPDRAALLRQALLAANAAVWARAHSGPYPREMGTTCTTLLLSDGQAYLGHVGDSRAYRIRGEHVEQLTTDHTIGEAARHDPSLASLAKTRGHHLTRAIGFRERVEVDARSAGPLLPGDRFLLCSDGLAPVGLDEIARAVHAYGPQEAADWLVALASTLGSRDNATAVVVHIVP
ncbi:PP2C family protein-serine/threonine phosphatase [Rubrivirga sp. IMCC43871]|uniref:PP2C family protein-serine/threonine phosphatase n=1 Tax=Rubrivirga sp. IMCC43871 TaxID=3391575 RepID=UPI00398FA5CC